jgi:hypothetical protein
MASRRLGYRKPKNSSKPVDGGAVKKSILAIDEVALKAYE